MKFSYDLLGSPALIKEIEVFGSTLSRDALVMRGTTSGTNKGGAIVAAGAFTDVIGVTQESIPAVVSSAYNENETPSVQSTGVVLLHKIITNPLAVYRCEYSQATADTFTATMTSAGTAITCASLEDLTGGFIYDVTSGQLHYISGGSGLTTLTAFSPAILATDYVLKIQPNFAKLVDLNTVSTMIGGTGQSQAAAGSGVVTILDTYISVQGISLQKLRPDLHDNLSLLGKNPKFFVDIMFPKHVTLHQS
jgi:hypothetical protein